MTLQNPLEKKLVIQVKHPEQELRELSNALEILCRSGLSKEEIRQQKLRIKEANVYHQLIRAYIRYLKFRTIYLEKQLAEAQWEEK
jgi:hypothetical protein